MVAAVIGTVFFVGALGGFTAGVLFSGSVRGEIAKLHAKADAILTAVRGH